MTSTIIASLVTLALALLMVRVGYVWGGPWPSSAVKKSGDTTRLGWRRATASLFIAMVIWTGILPMLSTRWASYLFLVLLPVLLGVIIRRLELVRERRLSE